MEIQLSFVKIPCMVLNLYNSKYSSDSLHQFSNCCNKPIGYKKFCKSCGEEVNSANILKGINENCILTREQEERLKEIGENLTIKVLGIKDNNNIINEIFPFVIKSQIVLPSLKKGFRQSDIKVFYGFKQALQKTNKYCIVKYIMRFKEHLGILLIYKDDLLFLELPFNHLNNSEEISRIKKSIGFETEKLNINEFTESAEGFIKEISPIEIETITEEKKELLNEMKPIILSNTKIPQEKRVVETYNPFLLNKK